MGLLYHHHLSNSHTLFTGERAVVTAPVVVIPARVMS